LPKRRAWVPSAGSVSAAGLRLSFAIFFIADVIARYAVAFRAARWAHGKVPVRKTPVRKFPA
jgi:hypothetical protein